MKNQSPKASEKLLARAKKLGLKAEIIENSKGHYRKDHPLGSTSVPQKVIEIEGKRFSVAGAKQYLNARENGRKAIHGSCDAFMDDEFIKPHAWLDKSKKAGIRVEWKPGNDFFPHLSCKAELPEIIEYEGGYYQGVYHFVAANTMKKDSRALSAACSWFKEIGEEYYVFWCHSIHESHKYGEQDQYDWVIWTPNFKHYNKRKVEKEKAGN